MKKSYFYGKVMEQKWTNKHRQLIDIDGFRLGKENSITDIFYGDNRPFRYERVVEEKIFFWDVLSVEFEIGWKVKIEDKVVIIKDIIHGLDGSIEYHTDKVISMATVKEEVDKV